MNIGQIDSRLAVISNIQESDLVWMDARSAPFQTYGLHDYQNQSVYRRIPKEVAEATSPGVYALHTNTAGGRVRFKTDSPYIAIRADMPSVCLMPHMTLAGSAGFDIYGVENNDYRHIDTFMPSVNMTEGYESITYVGEGGVRDYIINFPLYSPVNALYIGLHKNFTIEAGGCYRNDKPVVFYGSSITQGGCASRPGNCYQNFLSRWFSMDYINLGFSGNGKAEQDIAEYIASLDMQVFVCDYDHNAPSAEYLQGTHKRLYDTIRKKQPELPYIMISKPDTDKNPEDSRQRRDIIYASYRAAIDAYDQNVYFIDGETMFGKKNRDSCTVDGCHPNDLGFYRMAEAIGSVLSGLV